MSDHPTCCRCKAPDLTRWAKAGEHGVLCWTCHDAWRTIVAKLITEALLDFIADDPA